MLIPNWKRVARKAWSVRMLYLASILSGCEAMLPLIGDTFNPKVFAGITFVIVTAALLLRFLAQKELSD